ncbi:MAG TPA: ATP-grasp domain-containing protein [Burkholderiales bacterium]|nr:ATP-grasp domain-containing protein [Burkholderiales bacterium]
MRIFVYEHITGGGMLDDPQVAVLAPEGEMMLRALVDDLTAIPGMEVTALRDARLAGDLPASMHTVRTSEEFWPVFRRVASEVDAVWPIAPEQDRILARITREAIDCGRMLLGCRPDAVEIAASKRATADVLGRGGIPVIPVFADENSVPPEVNESVVKPDDGAGCQDTRLFYDRAELREWLQAHPDPNRILQPFVHGEARSLSMLCCDGRARLLACNRQKVRIAGGSFRFDGVSVNAVPDREGCYAELASRVARALPGLWGYCGVDFIETPDGPVVIEVNPRLTTSYAGLHRAIGLNPAKLVLGLPNSIGMSNDSKHESRAIEVEVAHAL